MQRHSEGLVHPRSLELWEEWQKSRRPGRQVARAARQSLSRVRRASRPEDSAETARYTLWTREAGSGTAPVLIALDSASYSSRNGVMTVLPYLSEGADVLVPAHVELPELAEGWTATVLESPEQELSARGYRAILSLGHWLGAGSIAQSVADRTGAASYVVQHGALTPLAPPLAEGVQLLSWSQADGDFWRSGREDITVLDVGSQMLWDASKARVDSEDVDPQAQAVFLGQLHGIELPLRVSAGSALAFCRKHGAVYRPHPSEKDAIARAVHAGFARLGVEIEPPTAPLTTSSRPVVSVFSTGVLEAAAKGIPSWVSAQRPPAWLFEFWDRYGMKPYGGEPTPAPEIPSDEPAARIARILEPAR